MIGAVMRYVYYGYGKKDKVSWGLLHDDDETITEGSGDPWRGFKPDKAQTELSDVRLFRPLAPGQIVEVDKGATLIKAPARTLGPNDRLILPRRVKQVVAIGRLGVVIGKPAKSSPEDKIRLALGYTCVIEFDASNTHRTEIAIAFGPTIACDIETVGLKVALAVNNQVVQQTTIEIDPLQAVEQASQQRDLGTGDIVMVAPQKNQLFETEPLFLGDVVQLQIENIGKLNLLCGTSR